MRETDKEVLHRMCNKMKLSDAQKEDIMKKIREEASGKQKRHFNVRRFAAVAASVLVLAGTTVYVEAKFDIIKSVSERVSNLYNKSQSGDVVLNEKEKEIIKELSLESTSPSETVVESTKPSEAVVENTTPSEELVIKQEETTAAEEVVFDMLEVGSEFEVDGGRIRIDGITYDGSLIYFMYTSFADEATPDNPINLIGHKKGAEGFEFVIKGKERLDKAWGTSEGDLDESEVGYQGYYIFRVSPLQIYRNIGLTGKGNVNNFTLSQGDVIVLTDRKYYPSDRNRINSLSELERIYGGFTLTKPVKDLVFTTENTEGMDVLETVTEIRLSPLSITLMGDEFRRETYPEGIGYVYRELSNDRKIAVGATGDKETESTRGGYAFKVIKKDGTVAAYGDMVGQGSGSTSDGDSFELFYDMRIFEKPLDLTEVDYILIWGWGLEYKLPVNVE